MSTISNNRRISDRCRMDDVMPHTDKGGVALSRAGIAAFNAARSTGACAEYAIACYLEAAASATA